MNAIKLGDVALRLHLQLLRLQAADKLACLACGVAVLGWLWLVPSQRDALERSKAALVVERAALAHLPTTPPALPVSSNDRNLGAFRAVLASRRNAEGHLGTIFSTAREARVALVKSEYKLDYSVPSRTWVYQIVMPVTGPYPAIRRFCEKVLMQLPFAALDEISFRRDSVAAGVLEARLRFSLHLDADAPRARSMPIPLAPPPDARGQQAVAVTAPAAAAGLPDGKVHAAAAGSTLLRPGVASAPDMRLASLTPTPQISEAALRAILFH